MKYQIVKKHPSLEREVFGSNLELDEAIFELRRINRKLMFENLREPEKDRVTITRVINIMRVNQDRS